MQGSRGKQFRRKLRRLEEQQPCLRAPAKLQGNVPLTVCPQHLSRGSNVLCCVSSWRPALARLGWAGRGQGQPWEQVVLSQAPRPSAPDTAAVLETGPGGQREEHGGGSVMFCRERNELSLMGPTHLSTGRHAASCVTEAGGAPPSPPAVWLCCSKCGPRGVCQIQIPGLAEPPGCGKNGDHR